MSIYDDEQEFSSNELQLVLGEWLKKQLPWNLQSAIWLLIRKDPEVPKNKERRISFAKATERELTTRALTLVLKAFADPKIKLNPIEVFGPTASKEERKVAVDYSVEKRDFIAWAETDWDDNVDHLTIALKQYDKTSKFKKPHATTTKSKLRVKAHEQAVNELCSEYPASARLHFTYGEFHDLIAPLVKSKKQTIYSKSKLYDFFTQFREQ